MSTMSEKVRTACRFFLTDDRSVALVSIPSNFSDAGFERLAQEEGFKLTGSIEVVVVFNAEKPMAAEDPRRTIRHYSVARRDGQVAIDFKAMATTKFANETWKYTADTLESPATSSSRLTPKEVVETIHCALCAAKEAK